MKYICISIFMILFFLSCNTPVKEISIDRPDQSLTQFVNPFIGTKNMGHTFPGATAPFGMVQLSPETNQQPMFIDGAYNKETYRYCSGYQYDDSCIYGFSHTHFSGTGHSDLGDFLIMPTTDDLILNPGNDALEGYHSGFSHNNEKAEPGYYSVKLDKYGIEAELTASDRVGFHRYTFSETEVAHIVLDLISGIYKHKDKNVWTFLRVENDSLVTGYRLTNGWARTRTVYFAMKFSKPIMCYGHKKYDNSEYNGFYRKFDEERNFPEMAGKNIRAWFNFDMKNDEQLMIRFALSPVSTLGALKNMKAEADHWDFDAIKTQTSKKWNKELNKIQMNSITHPEKVSFYTALYHTMLGPVIYEDVDGFYRGLDQNVHRSDGFDNYTIFSLWDTYRALHPLFNLIQAERNNHMIQSMLAHHDQSVHGMLPIWSHYANENWCMVGYHAVSVIADAIAKKNASFDINRALKASRSTANVPYFDGIGFYRENGFVAEDISSSSVSKTLEYAYDDWCIAQIAKAAGDIESYEEYMKWSGNYRNIYDVETGYMRPKLSDNTFRKTFDPLDTHGQGFIEGNAWNYGLYVPHAPDTMIAMMGGQEQFAKHLDRIFDAEIEEHYIEKNEDITRDGIIGNYIHGNEPGHHIPYLYNWTNEAWKTQSRVRMIMDTMYGDGVDGLCGNDDAGQMSAWFVFSSLGFYPVAPGSPDYSIGSPMVKDASILLTGGRELIINTMNQSESNVYVEKLEWNGQVLESRLINHNELMNGGTLTFFMADKPN
jgi:predicted alpha-1,2-mannosidase